MAFAVSFVSSLSGGIISHLLTDRTCTILSTSILVIMGLIMIYQSFDKKEDNEKEKYNIISNKEAMSVGFLLAIDDVGSSVSSGLLGYGPFMVGLPYFVVSFLIFFLANYGSKYVAKLNIGKKSLIISGVLMILMGIFELLD